MTHPPGDLLNVYAFMSEQRHMGMSEIVYSYCFYSGLF